jgi:hypothetical protein
VRPSGVASNRVRDYQVCFIDLNIQFDFFVAIVNTNFAQMIELLLQELRKSLCKNSYDDLLVRISL